MGNFGNVCFTLVIYVRKVFYFIFIVTFTLNKTYYYFYHRISGIYYNLIL